MKSILHRASGADIVDLPFPHLVIHNALEADLYEALASKFPPADVLLDRSELFSNRRTARYVELVKRIRYQRNTLVFFLHSPD